jgi:TRAP-type C4-dicarboxylate transport system substrate-binding protein
LHNVEASSKGDIKFLINGPETVPPFEQLQPTSAGLFQILFTHGAYHAGQTPFMLPIEGLSGDLKKWREAGVRDVIDKYYQKQFELKLLVLGQQPENVGFQIFLRQPIGQSGDLQGRKIRATQTYSGVLSLLKASPVLLPPGEIYTALDKGVVDGAAWPVMGALGFRWYEVAKYLLRPTFGRGVAPIFINLNAWNKLTDNQRQIFLDEARKIEDVYFVESAKLASDEFDQLRARGVQVTELGADQKLKLKRAFSDTLWEIAIKQDAKDIEPLRDFAKANGLY